MLVNVWNRGHIFFFMHLTFVYFNQYGYGANKIQTPVQKKHKVKKYSSLEAKIMIIQFKKAKLAENIKKNLKLGKNQNCESIFFYYVILFVASDETEKAKID